MRPSAFAVQLAAAAAAAAAIVTRTSRSPAWLLWRFAYNSKAFTTTSRCTAPWRPITQVQPQQRVADPKADVEYGIATAFERVIRYCLKRLIGVGSAAQPAEVRDSGKGPAAGCEWNAAYAMNGQGMWGTLTAAFIGKEFPRWSCAMARCVSRAPNLCGFCSNSVPK